jgi:hypothetical protein
MCRWLAYTGAPVRMTEVLYTPVRRGKTGCSPSSRSLLGDLGPGAVHPRFPRGQETWNERLARPIQ